MTPKWNIGEEVIVMGVMITLRSSGLRVIDIVITLKVCFILVLAVACQY